MKSIERIKQSHPRTGTGLLRVCICLAVVCTALTSCHTSKFHMARKVNIKTAPNATLFWENGQKMAHADSLGNAKVAISESMYRNGYKKITVAKAGYEPQTVKLKTRFNRRVLYNLFFPPAFLWGHYTTVSFKKLNLVRMDVRTENDALTYLTMAQDASSKRKKSKLLKSALYQDPDNEQGLAIVALNRLAELYYETKDYEDSQHWASCGKIIDPEDDLSKENFQRAINAMAEKAERKRRRAEMWNMILSTTSQGLAAASTIMSGVSGTGTTTAAYTGSTGSSGTVKAKKAKHCTHCGGMGKCRTCHGDGQILGKIDLEFHCCPTCNYNCSGKKEKVGKCTFCGGKGVR